MKTKSGILLGFGVGAIALTLSTTIPLVACSSQNSNAEQPNKKPGVPDAPVISEKQKIIEDNILNFKNNDFLPNCDWMQNKSYNRAILALGAADVPAAKANQFTSAIDGIIDYMERKAFPAIGSIIKPLFQYDSATDSDLVWKISLNQYTDGLCQILYGKNFSEISKILSPAFNNEEITDITFSLRFKGNTEKVAYKDYNPINSNVMNYHLSFENFVVNNTEKVDISNYNYQIKNLLTSVVFQAENSNAPSGSIFDFDAVIEIPQSVIDLMRVNINNYAKKILNNNLTISYFDIKTLYSGTTAYEYSIKINQMKLKIQCKQTYN